MTSETIEYVAEVLFDNQDGPELADPNYPQVSYQDYFAQIPEAQKNFWRRRAAKALEPFNGFN